ncbi:MAG: metal ABC transporter ATP-binding protein [Deferribacteraceae bacterium]|nr:metal ABC transporter ATP-binding protein [Deferribacteraceae bacterium]
MNNAEDIATTNIEPTCVTSKRAHSSLEHIERLDISVNIENLSVVFERDIALWDISFELHRGDHLVLMGQNGGGKTTLLKSLMGLVKPTAGKIYVYGKSAETQKKRVSLIPHASSVNWSFPIRLYDMVIMGTYSRIGWILRPGPTSRHKTADALKKLEIYDIRNKQISDLTASERQRALIARALVKEAEVFLMDEPLNGADTETEKIFWDLLRVLKENGKTVAAAYNNLQTAAGHFDRALLVNVKPIAFGPVNSVLTEENLRLAFGGKTGFLRSEESSFYNTAAPIPADPVNFSTLPQEILPNINSPAQSPADYEDHGQVADRSDR